MTSEDIVAWIQGRVLITLAGWTLEIATAAEAGEGGDESPLSSLAASGVVERRRTQITIADRAAIGASPDPVEVHGAQHGGCCSDRTPEQRRDVAARPQRAGIGPNLLPPGP
jgi:hypothetical protein